MPLRRFPAFLLCLVLMLSGVCALCVPARAASLHPGFQTLGLWDAESGLRMDVALWYPCSRSPSEIRYDDWSFRASRNARPAEGRHPLIVLSHDSEGSHFSLNLLAASLASSGFVVASPTHAGDNVDDMSLIFSAGQLSGRTREIGSLITELLRSPQTEGLIDPQRIGVLGVGPGGTAALLLAGGRLDASGWAGYCARAGSNDPYCTPWPASRMAAMIKSPELTRKARDPRIRAAAAVAPAYGMLFSRQSLSRLKIPLLLLRADLDAVNRAPHHADAIRAALPREPEFAVLENTDGASLISPCSSTLAQTLPEVCTGVSEDRRENAQEQLSEHAVAFFLKTLGAPNLPPLPDEQVDEPAEKVNDESDTLKQGTLKPAPAPASHGKPAARKPRRQ